MVDNLGRSSINTQPGVPCTCDWLQTPASGTAQQYLRRAGVSRGATSLTGGKQMSQFELPPCINVLLGERVSFSEQ